MEMNDAIALTIEMLDDDAKPPAVLAALEERGLRRDLARSLAMTVDSALRFADEHEDEELTCEDLAAHLVRKGAPTAVAREIADQVLEGGDDDEDDEPVIRLAEARGVPVIQLGGDLSELTQESRAAVRGLIDEVLAGDCRFVIDLGAVEHLQADLLGMLIGDVMTMREVGGEACVCAEHDDMHALVTGYGVHEVVPVVREGQAALDRLAGLPRSPTRGERLGFARDAAGEVGILAARGVIDARTLAQAEREIARCIERTPRVLLDATDVVWISSGGFGLLVKLASRARKRGGALRLAGLRGPARRVVEALGLGDTLDVHETRAEALAAFG